MATCPSKFRDFKINTDQLDIDEFFYINPAVDWGFENYSRWYTEKNKKAKINTIIEYYKDSLFKIKNYSTLNDDIISYAGDLSNNLVSYKKTRSKISELISHYLLQNNDKKRKGNQIVNIGTNSGVAINNGSVVINNYESSSNKKQKAKVRIYISVIVCYLLAKKNMNYRLITQMNQNLGRLKTQKTCLMHGASI